MIHGNDPAETLVDFIRFACDFLDLRSIPDIDLIEEPIAGRQSNSFAAYIPGEKRVILYAKNRHILDVLRSLCHELVHYRQDLKGQLSKTSGQTGSPQENEANAVAGQIMRLYGKKHPELYP